MPNQRPLDDPWAWLDRSRSNLTRARHTHPDVYLEDLCFDAQQAAEKALKGLLIHLGAAFPYTHDVADLITLIEDHDLPVPESVKDAAILTDYAVATRYPGVGEPVTEDEHERAVAIAERVVEWVKGHVKTGGETPGSRTE
ncbi:HEPN domain-containing protein [Salinibacter sp.]|uniref:HEPN domain-containing protein n=1 Tax=Salinibacter sp. TaxID=2065818 RepID=UPI0021E95BDA|nr:HEPN domain-containing protein [Salinibacter sp.]